MASESQECASVSNLTGEGTLSTRNTNYTDWTSVSNAQGATTSTYALNNWDEGAPEYGSRYLRGIVDNFTLSGYTSMSSVQGRLYVDDVMVSATGSGTLYFSSNNGTAYCSGHTINMVESPGYTSYVTCSHYTWTDTNVDSMRIAFAANTVDIFGIGNYKVAIIQARVNFNTATAPPAPPTPTITGLGTNGGDASGKFTVNLLDDNGNGGSAFTNVLIEIATDTGFTLNKQSWNATTGIGDESHEFTGCLNGTSASPSRVTYYARGRYDNAIGTGSWSGNASTQTYTYPTAPSTGSFNTVGSAGGDDGGTVNTSVTEPDNGGTAMTSVTLQIDDNASFNNGTGRRQQVVDGTPSAPQTNGWTGMRYNTTYYLRAIYTNAVGQGQYSSSLGSTTMWDYPPTASAPTNAQSPPNADQMTVTSSQPTMDGTRTDMEMQVDQDSGFGSPDQTLSIGGVPTSPDSITFTSLVKNTNYYSRVRWKNEVGWASAYSSASTVHLVKGVPDAPVFDSLVASGETSLTATWTEDANDGGSAKTDMEYQLNGGGFVSFGGDITSPSEITGLTAGTSYSVQVRTENAYGVSDPFSNTIAKYTETSAPTVTSFSLYGKHGGVIIFTGVTGASSYNVDINKDGAGFVTLENGVILTTYNFTHDATENVSLQLAGVNPDGIEGTMSTGTSTIDLPHQSFLPRDPFKVILSNPLMKVVRATLQGGESQLDYYDGEALGGDSEFIFDFILEAGKKAITIVPVNQNRSQRAVGVLASLYNPSPFDVSILGLEDMSLSDVAGLSITPSKIPLTLMLNRGNGLLVGFGANKFYDTYAVVESNGEYLESTAFTGISDDNTSILYTYFANKYYQPDDTELQLHYEYDVMTGGVGTTADSSASGGNYRYDNNGTTIVTTFGNLKRGSYMVLARMKGSVNPTNIDYRVEKDTALIETYGHDIGNGAEAFDLTNTTYEVFRLPFTVDDETASYTVEIQRNTNEVRVDCIVLVPITNGKDFVMDLYTQGLSLSNNKYIGEI